MRRGNVWRIVLLLVVVVAAGATLYARPIQLGLDLRGGIHAVLQARPTDGVEVSSDVMERAVAVIERRVNALGVAEPVIQRQGADRIVVELPGVRDAAEAMAVIGRTAQLEIKDPWGRTVLTGADLADARLGRDDLGRWAVDVTFTAEGTQKFARLTTQYVGQQIPHVLDGEILVNPVVNEPITRGTGQITGGFSMEEARNLAILLRAGALPVPLDVAEIRQVGPTLGQESIDRSLKAGIVGAVLVLLFMLSYYRLPGLVADIALAVYVVLVLSLLAAVNATLTLPGIAGLILSIGMAVDANVIIFERIREELRNGRRLRAAIDTGFHRAMTAIVDANLTTLITCGVLFYFGTGPVKGFAVTLSLGIVASMFTAVVLTRWLLGALVDVNPERLVRYFGVREAVSS